MKLPNGYGSVYKRSGNRRKPFVVMVTTGWNELGKQIRKSIGSAKTRTEALQMLSEYHKTPYNLDYKNLMFGDVWNEVDKELDKLLSKNKMSESNIKGLRSHYNNYCKELYKIKLLDLKYKKMQSIIDNAKTRKGKDLGYTGKSYIKAICIKIFDYAMNIYELPLVSNPAAKLSVGDKPKSNKHIPFSEEEIDKLWSMEDNDLVKVILINSYSGLRPNEIFSTSKSNIFLDDNYFITGSKTEAGKDRIIPIHPRIKYLVEYFYKNDSSFPFKQIIEDFNYNKFGYEFESLMTMLNFTHTPYDSRHTFATRMKKAGANEFIIKIIMGHSIVDITENVYTHRTFEELFEEIKKIK